MFKTQMFIAGALLAGVAIGYFAGGHGDAAKPADVQEEYVAKKAVSEMLAWYDSYRFSPRSEICVCNPISVGRALKNGRIGPYWSSTGNATLIVERLRQVKKLPIDLEGVETTESSLESCDVKSLPVISLMYQGGCLTIKGLGKTVC